MANETIKCVYMDKMYGVRPGDLVTTEDAYWIEDILFINSFYLGEGCDIPYSVIRIIEMKVEGAPNIRIDTPIVGKVVGRINIDSFRNVTMFELEV